MNSSIIKTGSFGDVSVNDRSIIEIPNGLLGFPEYKKFCLVDSGDETLILWLQSLDKSDIAFPVLEPRFFTKEYIVRLSASELKDLQLANINQGAVLTVLTIPEDVTQMTANLKAPLVINLEKGIARQVVLQENENSIKHPMFKELKAHLLTIEAQMRQSGLSDDPANSKGTVAVTLQSIPASPTLRALQS